MITQKIVIAGGTNCAFGSGAVTIAASIPFKATRKAAAATVCAFMFTTTLVLAVGFARSAAG